MNQPLPELLNSLESELLRLGYTEGTMTFYRNRWKKLLDFAKKRDEKYFTEDLGMAFAEEILNIPLTSGKLTQRETQDLRVVRMIGDFALHHSILRRYYKHKELLHTPEFLSCRDRFADYCEQKMYSNVTTEHYLKQASYLLDYLESQNITACTDITIQNIHAYLNTLGGYTYKTIEQRICGIRAFLRFLNESGIYPNNLAEQTPMIQARKHTRIPSVWTEAELKQLLSVIDRGNPKGKRDYAIILLACFLGLRVSDIKKLTFSCFDWREKRLTLVQSKTHQPVVLPLPDEVGWAVIDYLKNGRPAVDTDIVFVRHIAPFLPFSEADHLYQLIRDYMRLAHLPTLKKHRGMHSLRHTAASRMLESGVPLETISQILGHEDPDSTDVYLKTDVERLRECCEELEEVCR